MVSRKFAALAGITGLLVSVAATAMAGPTSTEDFVKRASVDNEFSMESGKLAMEKSQNKDVKRLAGRMVDEHTKQDTELGAILQSSQSGLHAEVKLDDSHQQMMNRLQSLAKDDFNLEYISMQKKVNQDAIGIFSDYAENGSDPAIRKFASGTVSLLKSQSKQADEIQIKQ